jgi:hypothetical protein
MIIRHTNTLPPMSWARITADRLIRHLQQSGFVIIKASAATAPTTIISPSTG